VEALTVATPVSELDQVIPSPCTAPNALYTVPERVVVSAGASTGEVAGEMVIQPYSYCTGVETRYP
jgi:hypothetical protein